MKTIILAFFGSVAVLVLCWVIISYSVWEINPIKWKDNYPINSFWAIVRLFILAFIAVYYMIKTYKC